MAGPLAGSAIPASGPIASKNDECQTTFMLVIGLVELVLSQRRTHGCCGVSLKATGHLNSDSGLYVIGHWCCCSSLHLFGYFYDSSR